MEGTKNKVWDMSEENKVIFDRDFKYQHLNEDGLQCDGEEHYVEYQEFEYIAEGEFIKAYTDRFELWCEDGMIYQAYSINEIIEYYKNL